MSSVWPELDEISDFVPWSEAFLELVAMTRFDSTAERDKHWKSLQGFCSACTIDYDFVLKQEEAMAENDFLVSILGVKNESFHIPGMFKQSNGPEQFRSGFRNERFLDRNASG